MPRYSVIVLRIAQLSLRQYFKKPKRKRLLLMLVLCLLAFTPVLSVAENTQEDAAIFSVLQASYPGLQAAVTDTWGNTAAAVFEYQGTKILCILNKLDGTWRIALDNPHALMQDEPLPSILLDSDTALYWRYDTYPLLEFTALYTDGVWGSVSQTARTTSNSAETMEDMVYYQDGEIVHSFYHCDENDNVLNEATERLPAPWLADCDSLESFDINRFPLITEVEYDGQWPSRSFIEQAAAYLMPNYTFVSGSFASGRLRFLMDKPNGSRVFVGCGTGKDPVLVESTPLPSGTNYGVENFTNSLNINGMCLSLSPQDATSDTWMVSFVMPYEEGTDDLTFGPNCVLMGFMGETHICVGENPWSDITKIDWTTLPKSFQEAVDDIDGNGWALVNNPDPADRLHLRTDADTRSASLGKYYNGTPVKVMESHGDWVKIDVLGRSGWMLKKYLSFTQPCETLLSAMPQLQFSSGTAHLYASPDSATAFTELIDSYGMFVIGMLGEEWYHVWFPQTNTSGFIQQSELFPGNG